MATVTNTNAATRRSNGLGAKTHIISFGVGGGAISQAQMDGFVRGITSGASLVTGATATDSFTIAAVGPFTAASSTAVILAVQGTGTPSTTTGDYYAAATVSSTVVFDNTF